MRITFDQAKDATNLDKHGVPLALAGSRKANRRQIELYENEADSTEAETDSTDD